MRRQVERAADGSARGRPHDLNWRRRALRPAEEKRTPQSGEEEDGNA